MNNKITYDKGFLPKNLMENLIESAKCEVTTIEEQNTELYYDVYEGFGKFDFKNGMTFNGPIERGLMQSTEEKKGTLKLSDGTLYIGDFEENEIKGQGIYEFASGSIYQGRVDNGLRNGIGTFTNEEQGVDYSGNWKNGKMHGEGRLVLEGNLTYEGAFYQGKRTGLGKTVWKSKNSYFGNQF